MHLNGLTEEEAKVITEARDILHRQALRIESSNTPGRGGNNPYREAVYAINRTDVPMWYASNAS